MYTRCPACRTVFHVTAAELRAAEGTVICGACGATFDAIASLSETRPPEGPGDEAQEAPPAADAASEPDERARDEDEFLEEIESLIGAEGPADDSGSGEPVKPLESEQMPAEPAWALLNETTLPRPPTPELPATLLRAQPPRSTAPRAAEAADEELPDLGSLPAIDDEFDEFEDDFPDPDSVFRLDDDDRPEDLPGEPDSEEDGEALANAPLKASAKRPDAKRDVAAAAPASRGEMAAPATGSKGPGRADAPAETGDDIDALPEFAHAPRRGKLWLRVLAPVIVMLVLLVTWVHAQRGHLLRHPAGEALLAPTYRFLRLEAVPEWQPDELRVLRSEAVASADRPDDLEVAVQFHNAADFAQPYPVIRISLQDRFGRPLGTHDFGPAQYLRNQPAGERLAAGGQVQATVTVPDPNARADGFRVSLCVEVAGRGLVCAPEPFRQP